MSVQCLLNGRLPANLLQAQRDYFGAHMYERIDRERGVYILIGQEEVGTQRPQHIVYKIYL